jgi:hypothetical protein
MAWKTKGGNYTSEGSRVVYIRNGAPDFTFTGTVLECLPVNDDDDGEIRIRWDNNDGPERSSIGSDRPRIWYYPFHVEIIDQVNAADRIAGQI